MKYKGIYFMLVSGIIKKVLTENFDKEFATETVEKSKEVYKDLIRNAYDIGEDNPLAYTLRFVLAFVSPYIATEKGIDPKLVQDIMRRSISRSRLYFALTNFNRNGGKRRHLKKINKYVEWYKGKNLKQHPQSFKIDFVGRPYKMACYYRITRCPINTYFEELGISELMPLVCDLEDVIISLGHGNLHRESTIASGGEFCDCWVIGDAKDEKSMRN